MAPTDAARPTRRDPVWLWLLAAALLVARVATGVWEERHPPVHPNLVSWVPAENAVSIADQSARPILYDFSAEWCGPCRTMEQEVFGDEKAAQQISRLVVPVHVVDRTREDGRNSALVDSLQRAYGVEAFPTLAIVWRGKLVDRKEGYPGAEPLIGWIRSTAIKAHMGDAMRGPGGIGTH